MAFVEWDGKRHYLPGGHGSAESVAAYKTFVAVNVFGSPAIEPVAGQLPISLLAARYLQHAKQHYGYGTRNEYANMRNALLSFADAHLKDDAAKFGPMKLKAYREVLVKSGKSREYVNQIVSRIKRAFRWAVSEELIPPSVYHGLQSVASLQAGRTEARETAKRQPVPWEHVEPVLAELSPTVRAMVTFQWHVGCRSKSLCLATASQFTKDGDLLLWRPRHKTESRGKVLVLPVGPKAHAAIKSFMGAPDAFLFNPRRARKNRRYNARYTTGAYANAVRRAIKRVNVGRPENEQIPHWSPHQLRHSKGTAVRHSHGIEAAQAVLGHDSLDATEIYSASRLELAKRVARETG